MQPSINSSTNSVTSSFIRATFSVIILIFHNYILKYITIISPNFQILSFLVRVSITCMVFDQWFMLFNLLLFIINKINQLLMLNLAIRSLWSHWEDHCNLFSFEFGLPFLFCKYRIGWRDKDFISVDRWESIFMLLGF